MTPSRRPPDIRLKFAFILPVASALFASRAEALEWRWSYQGEGVAASGAFTTKDEPGADGFYEITGITGEANGVTITGLQPPGTSIPGNDGYPVDNLVRTEAPRLTMHGFGYKLADGTYANPFYGAHFAKPGAYAFFSDPANKHTSEPAVTFSAGSRASLRGSAAYSDFAPGWTPARCGNALINTMIRTARIRDAP